MNSKKNLAPLTIVKIKDRDGNFLDKNQTIKAIERIKSQLNPDSRSTFLNYQTKENNVFLPTGDLSILEAKLSQLNCRLDKQVS